MQFNVVPRTVEVAVDWQGRWMEGSGDDRGEDEAMEAHSAGDGCEYRGDVLEVEMPVHKCRGREAHGASDGEAQAPGVVIWRLRFAVPD